MGVWRNLINVFLLLVFLITSYSVSFAADRAPFVANHKPRESEIGVRLDASVSITWSQPMASDTEFVVNGPDGPLEGKFDYDPESYTVSFTPVIDLTQATHYSVLIQGQVDAVGRVQEEQFQWSFDTVAPTSVTLAQFSAKPDLRQSWWWSAWPSMMILISVLSLVGFILVWEKRPLSRLKKV